MPLALYAARAIEQTQFEDVLSSAIDAGGDTDTIASMTGQIAGAWLGMSQIPRGLIDRLPDTAYIERVTNEFAGALRDI